MAQAQHTPDGWYATGEIVREVASDCIIARATDGGHVDGDELFDAAQREANARVMAAAPELAEALGDILRIIDAVRLSAGLGEKQIERVKRARAVLAKAEAR